MEPGLGMRLVDNIRHGNKTSETKHGNESSGIRTGNEASGIRPGNEASGIKPVWMIASFPGRSRLQFLIAYCMQKRRGKAWEKESHA